MAGKTVNWRVTPKNLARLDKVEGVEDGSVSLHATGLDEPSYERLGRFLTEHGSLVRILKATAATGSQKSVDLLGVDFALHCPNLKTLEITRVRFNDSPFAHPVLNAVRLKESHYEGPRELTLGEVPLRRLVFDDCVVAADRITIARESRLTRFEFWLDEDFADTCPDHFDVYGTSLTDITVSAAWNWTVTQDYESRDRLRYRTMRAGRYNTGTYIYHGLGDKTHILTYGPSEG